MSAQCLLDWLTSVPCYPKLFCTHPSFGFQTIQDYPCGGVARALLKDWSEFKSDEKPYHVVLIVGLDLSSKNVVDHTVEIKNSWGKDGFADVQLAFALPLTIPRELKARPTELLFPARKQPRWPPNDPTEVKLPSPLYKLPLKQYAALVWISHDIKDDGLIALYRINVENAELIIYVTQQDQQEHFDMIFTDGFRLAWEYPKTSHVGFNSVTCEVGMRMVKLVDLLYGACILFVLDMPAYEAWQREYASKGHKHFYFMTLNGSEICSLSECKLLAYMSFYAILLSEVLLVK
ncbi:arginine--tRNA ligase, chloroplastic/mitochondrial isoform X2 [Tanacetum coccineum]